MNLNLKTARQIVEQLADGGLEGRVLMSVRAYARKTGSFNDALEALYTLPKNRLAELKRSVIGLKGLPDAELPDAETPEVAESDVEASEDGGDQEEV